MPVLQFIEYRRRAVAVVIGAGQAVVSEHVPDGERAIVHAMCVYAMEVAAGDRPGPYRDDAAERHATTLLLKARHANAGAACSSHSRLRAR